MPQDAPEPLPCPRTLRDGRRALLRRVTPEDSPALERLYRCLAVDGRGMVLRPDEVVLEELRAKLEGARPEELHLALERDGELIGDVGLHPFKLRMLAHTGLVGLGVHPDWQGLGVGRLLMEEVLARGRAQGVLRAELYVRADNVRAVALYRSMGFQEEGRRLGFVRTDEAWVDDLMMALWLAPRP